MVVGQLLGGRYQILHTLSAGNFGQTYLAEDVHRPESTKCVVKQLKPASNDLSFLPTARNLFKREAQTLEKLGSHEQIPRLLAYFEEQQEFYLVQEFIQGRLLRQELSQRWAEEQVIQLLQQILNILDFVHHYGVIHRDLKPDNIIRRQQDGKLVLIDFGAVKQVQVALGGAMLNSTEGTIAIGTPGYMAPEQAQGRPRPNSDIYALGIIAIQALTGLSPIELRQDNKGEINWQTPQIQVSSGLAAILNKMVRYHFQDRYQSAADVLQALQHLVKTPSFLQKVRRLLHTPVNDLLIKPSPTSTPAPTLGQPTATPAQATPLQTPAPPSAIAAPVSSTGAITHNARVFISYRGQDQERDLARQIHDALATAGHQPFMAGESMHLEEGWAQQIDQALKECDYFLLLLSQQSAYSEMILAEVRTVKQLRDMRSDRRPTIIPVRVDFPMQLPLNYELRGYLHRLQQRFWRSPEDTPGLIQDLLTLLPGTQNTSPAITSSPATTGSFPTVPPAAVAPSDTPPLPVAEPELPEGQVNLASAFYLERPPIEARCYQTITQAGALIRIKAPRQMGKTSLMARILHQATQEGHRTVALSLQLADAKVFADLDQFLRWLCASVSRRLRLPNQLAEYWDPIFGSKYNCTAYFEEYLLTEIDSPLTLGLDEVDRIFEYPEIASDFFGLLRAWHEEAKNREIWQRLRLIVVHATEVYIPLNTNQSPFNVGLPIELPEFDRAQVAQLAQLHGLNWSGDQVEQLWTMIGGHPYLVRLALYHVSRGDFTLEQLLAAAPTEAGLFRDHLRGHWWNLQQHPDLAAAFKAVVMADQPVRLEATALFKLHSLGLIRIQGNEAQLRCELYRQYFRFVEQYSSTDVSADAG